MSALAHAATDATTWPDVVVYLACFALIAFIVWIWNRR